MNAALALALALTMPQPYGPHLRYDSRVLIMGLPTCGKTVHAQALTRQSFRVLWATPEPEDFRAPGRLEVSADELERWPGLLDDPHCRILVPIEGDDAREQAEQVKTLIRLAFAAENLVVCLDEVGDYQKHAEGHLRRLVRRGRHRGLASVLVSQFATDFPLTVRRAASDVRVFAQKHKAELDALAEVYGEPFAAKCAAWRKYDPPATWSLSEV